MGGRKYIIIIYIINEKLCIRILPQFELHLMPGMRAKSHGQKLMNLYVVTSIVSEPRALVLIYICATGRRGNA